MSIQRITIAVGTLYLVMVGEYVKAAVYYKKYNGAYNHYLHCQAKKDRESKVVFEQDGQKWCVVA